MAGVPGKHLTSSKVRRRRSHLALKPTGLGVCSNCKHPVLPHKICSACGFYKGKLVIKPKLKVKK